MAIAVRSETTNTGTGDINGQMSVAKPADVQTGDVLVCIMGAGDDAPAIAAPGDWTQGDQSGDATGNDRQIGIFYKVITNGAGEPSAYTFSVGFADNAAWWIGSLSGVDTSNPQDEAMTGNSVLVQNSATPAAPEITTATPNAFVLAGWATNFDSTQTMPGGSWATRANNIALTNIAVNVASQTFAAAGGTGAGGVSLSNGTATAETQCGQWAFRAMIQVSTPSDTATLTESVVPNLVLNAIPQQGTGAGFEQGWKRGVRIYTP